MKVFNLFIIIISHIILAENIIAQEFTIKIIVNSSSNIESLSKLQIAKLFLKEITQWENGMTVKPVDQVGESTVRKYFSMPVVNDTFYFLPQYFLRKILSYG